MPLPGKAFLQLDYRRRPARQRSPSFESVETALNNNSQIVFPHGITNRGIPLVPAEVEVLLRANTATAQGWVDNEQMKMTFPYKPKVFRGALVKKSDNQSFNDGVTAAITWDQEEYDSKGLYG